jgi:hypothetical protein
MPAPNKALKHWQSIIDDSNETKERQDTAAKEAEKIRRRYARIKAGRKKKGAYHPLKDPKPECTCGGLQFCSQDCAVTKWERRQDEYYAANPKKATTPTPAPAPKIEPPKPAPVLEDFLNELQLDAWAEPAPVRKPVVARKPVPKIVEPKPAAIVRKTREGHSGFFFDEVYWNLSPFDRQCQNLYVKAYPKLQMELRGIQEAMATEAALHTPVQKPLTDEEKHAQDIANEAAKHKAFTAPMVLPQNQAFATGQIETVDEHRAKFGQTMGNATPNSGIDVPIDQRGWRNADQIHTPTMVPTKNELTSD